MPKSAPHMPAQLSQAAFELFSEKGFAKVTLDEIAAHAGVTKGSLYCHYKSKHELILAACSHYYRTYQRRVHNETARIIDPLERLHVVLSLSVRTCVLDDKNRMFTTELFSLSLKHEDVRASWAQFYDSAREMYVGLIIAAEASGHLEVEDPRTGADMMLSAMEGIKQRATFESHIGDTEEQQRLVKALMNIIGRVTESAIGGSS